jgi:predicted amidophosphoribosyltransferase
MESDTHESELGESDLGASEDVATTRHRPAPSRTPMLPPPLPAGYELRFFSPLCYSPYGTSPRAQLSRRLRDQVKRAEPATLADCVGQLLAMIAAGLAPNFLKSAGILIPIPRRTPDHVDDPISAPHAIAQALHLAGLGDSVWPALRRTRAIPKSAWSRPGSRPEFLEHCASLELLDLKPPAQRFLLVDDFITRGRTLLAAAAVLYQALPRAHIRAFALIRTEGLAPDIATITAPTSGTIRFLGGDAFRSP